MTGAFFYGTLCPIKCPINCNLSMYYSYKRQTTKTMAKRYSAQDYLKEWNELENKQRALSAKITERLVFLAKKYPNDTYGSYDDAIVSAKLLGKNYVNTLSPKIRIELIQAIEKFLADRHPHKQLSINF